MRTHTYSCTSITRVIYKTMPYTFLDKAGKPTDLNKQKKALVVLTPGGHQGVSINKHFLYFTPSTRNWRFWRSGSPSLGWQHTGVSSPLVLLWSRGQDSFWRCTCGKNSKFFQCTVIIWKDKPAIRQWNSIFKHFKFNLSLLKRHILSSCWPAQAQFQETRCWKMVS